MVNAKAPQNGCGCLRLQAEQSLTDASADELEKAHAIIRIMLNSMSNDAKRELAYRIAVAGLEGEGTTRANEREALLKRMAIARAGRSPAPVLYPQEQVAKGATLALHAGRPLLAHDLAVLATALSDLADAATAVLVECGETPACKRLRTEVVRLGVERQRPKCEVSIEVRACPAG